MKIAKGAIGRTVDEPKEAVRFYLFHGPDQAQSRALGYRLVQALGADRFIIISNAIRSDPVCRYTERRGRASNHAGTGARR